MPTGITPRPALLTARSASGTFSPAATRRIPTKKGAVLRYLNSYTYATLAPHASTKATRLEGQQEIYFFDSGRGTATAAGQTVDLYRNIAILMPANLEFTLKNTGDQPLTMYVINEPTPPNFRPNSTMLVRDENKLPITSSDGLWAHIVKDPLRDCGRTRHAAECPDRHASIL